MFSNPSITVFPGRALASPVWTFFTLIAAVLVATRIYTGYLRWKHQNQVSVPEKTPSFLPYWIPFLGHVPAAVWSFPGLMNRGRDRTRDGIFGIHMVGSNHYAVVMPSLVKQYFLKRGTVLSNDSINLRTYENGFGDEGAAKRISMEDCHAVHKTLNVLMKGSFVNTAIHAVTTKLEELVPSFVSFSADESKQMRWEKEATPILIGIAVEVDLYQLIMDFVADITSTVIMGSAFITNYPETIKDIWALENGFISLVVGVPLITPKLSKAHAARTRLHSAMKEWNQKMRDRFEGQDVDPKWGDMSDVSEPMVVRMKALTSVDAEEKFMTASMVGVYFALQVNANRVIFWMLLQIVSTSELLATIQKEIAPYAKISDDGHLDLDADSLCKSCPVFKATFLETMRLYTDGVSYKQVLEEVTLTESEEDAANFGKARAQSYHISKGDFLVIPHATMQSDPRLWKHPAVFDPYRFIVPDEKNSGEFKVDSLHLHAFGGGPTMCKGRTFAEREALIFVAGLLSAWDFNPPDGKWKMPSKVYNGTGTASPKGEVRIRLSRREL